MTFRPGLLAWLLVIAVGAASGQTLARKGWAGSGITVEPWFEGAVLYQVDPLSVEGLQGVIGRLDYLQALHVDALVLSPLPLQAGFGRTSGVAAFDPKYGGEEDLDKLVQEASRRRMRVFVDVRMDSSHSTQQNLEEARFWLSRGMAGLRLTGDALPQPQLADRLRQLQKLCATYAGQRVLLWDMPGTMPVASAPRSRHAATISVVPTTQMMVDRRLLEMTTFTADGLRAALAAEVGSATRVPESDTGGHAPSFDRYGVSDHKAQTAKLLATALLTNGGAPLIYFGQEGSGEAVEDGADDSLLNWYRKLSALHHENAALHGGTMRLIAETNPDIVAWIRTPVSGVPVVVVCNLTDRTLRVSVSAEVRKLGIETGPGMMHTLASTAMSATEPVSMNGIALGPFGVYLGELPRPPGLESAPSPLRRTSR